MTPHKTSPLLLAGLTLTVLAATVACGGGPGSSTSSSAAFDPKTCQGGTLDVLNSSSQKHFDPARLYTSGGGAIPSLVFRTLTTRHRIAGDEGEKPVPDLATDLGTPSDGAKTWTYHLKDGLKFEDGSPITAKDVKYGIERSFSPDLPGGAPYLHDWLVGGTEYKGPYGGADLASIETPDVKTIIFKLRAPHGDFPYLATATQFAPVPQAKDTKAQYEYHPLSSGPYKIETYEKGKRIVLVRNTAWSRSVDDQRLACPDRIEITQGLDPTVINQRLAGSVGADARAITTDTSLAPAQLAQLGSDPALARRAVHGSFPETFYLAFDTTRKPFDDLRVRQAVAYAVNRRSAVDAAGGSSLAYPATTFLPESKAFGQQASDPFPAGPSGNAAKARELLAQAGQAGLTFDLSFENTDADNYGPKQATALQDALKQAGITVNLKPLNADNYREVTGKPSTQPVASLQGWGADWPAGGPFLIPIFDGRQILKDGGNFNLAQLDDPAVNKEIDAISAITDPARAAQRWGALDGRIAQQALIVPLFHSKYVYLFGKGVKNAYLDQWRGTYDIASVSVK
jgi:peptide/nickel transport system substrate-binding protein